MIMEFNIDVCTQPDGLIIIRDFSKEYGQYLSDDVDIMVSHDAIKYKHTATLNCITRMTSNTITLVDVLLEEHKEDKLDSAYFRIDKDGYYVIDHIVLPTTEWLEEAPEECFKEYETIYVTDKEKLYKVVEGELIECTIKEVMERNIDGTTLMKCKLDVFFTGHLQECYINYCKNVFDSLSKCAPVNRDYDTYARDFIWMTLNIIDYLIGFKQYLEAQRLLEMFQTCNGFCNDRKLHGFKSKSCGCS